MSDGGIQSVRRAFAVLDAVAASGGQAGITALAAETGLAESTVHRMATSLVELGCLRRLPDRRYALASRLVRLGAAATKGIGHQAEPTLRALVDALGESANLATLAGDKAEYIAQAPSRHSMRMFTEVGRKVDLHCTGVGKAILSALPDDGVERIVDQTGLPARTAHSITDKPRLLEELARAREAGYCLDEEEQELGVRCVAMPIRISDFAILAVSVSGPTLRMNDELVSRAVPLLRDAARQIGALVQESSR